MANRVALKDWLEENSGATTVVDGMVARDAWTPPKSPRPMLVPAGVFPTAAAGRNDPCPCGSGVKYKKCHAGRWLGRGKN